MFTEQEQSIEEAEYRQWHHRSIGSRDAWKITRGLTSSSMPVRVALIDEGCDVWHPDLTDAVVGGAETDPNGGMRRWTKGTDYIGDPHGTACAGLVAARSSVHGLGLAFEASLVVFEVLGWSTATQGPVVAAIEAAAGLSDASLACDVICCSLGPRGKEPFSPSKAMRAALAAAASRGRSGFGCPIVWSVPTENAIGQDVSASEHVLAVGSVDAYGRRFGAANVASLYAPGQDVVTTVSPNNWGVVSGTSYAAPLVAGAAALVLACRPTMTALDVRKHLVATSKNGVLNIGAAIQVFG